jgi:hypothetical protein
MGQAGGEKVKRDCLLQRGYMKVFSFRVLINPIVLTLHNARGLEKPEAMGNEKPIVLSNPVPGNQIAARTCEYIPSLYPASPYISTELYELEIIVIMMILIQMQ